MKIKEFVKDSLTKYNAKLWSDYNLTPRMEHVYVVCRAAEGEESDMHRVSAAGGKVHIKMFNPATYDEKEVAYTIPSNGVVEADIPFGMRYEVYSTLSGYGASFRLTFPASTNKRYVHLWNLPIGVYKFGYGAIANEDGNKFRCVPIISSDGSFDDFGPKAEWDKGNNDYYDYDGSDESDGDIDDSSFGGVLLSTAESSLLLYNQYKSDTDLYWSKQAYGRSVPGLEEFYITKKGDYDKAVAAAKKDFSGNLNTDKILSFLNDAPAADFACKSAFYIHQRYLPSVGELFAIYSNKANINSFISAIGASDFPQLDNNNYWSSSACSSYHSWYVSMLNGTVDNDNRRSDLSVLAVSAFTYIY